MHVDPPIVLGSAVVGLLVGMTGAGGGALMTPMLILLFGVKAPSAISSDLVAAVLMRPVGAIVHMRKGTVNYRLVGWLILGCVPMALAGAFFLHLLGAAASPTRVEQALGAALLTGAAAMVIRYVVDIRTGRSRAAALRELAVRPLPTVAIGMIGGFIVGMTSVGSGSLMIVLLLFLYPTVSAGQLVGTDLTQAVPLTLAAALGALVFGAVQFGVTLSIIVGSVPAVLVGALFSARAPDRFIRPIITLVILASGLKYAGFGGAALGWACGTVLVLGATAWLAMRLRRPAPATDVPDGARTRPGAADATALDGTTPDPAALDPAALQAATVHAATGHAATGHAATGHTATVDAATVDAGAADTGTSRVSR